MSTARPQRHALVLGASGLIGRHVTLALRAAGAEVTTATRSEASADRLSHWLADHGVRDGIRDIRVDFAASDLVADGSAQLGDVTEIHNCAGSYRFGMTVAEARRANVDSVERIVDLAAGLPELQRLVHVSGYRVGGQDPADVPWSRERTARIYRELGPYEASKVEADATLQARARERGVPWSIVNPSTVIGDSRTGESDQQLGLATSLGDLWHGRTPALPGSADTFVPVVTADHLARFMALLPTDEDAAGRSYWVLDDRTPPLPGLLGLIGAHYEVKVPRLRIPVEVIRRLPQRITRADPETLSFLSSDRYPTGPADAFAERHGLGMPPTTGAILAWADHLAAHRFGDAPDPARRFIDVAGTRTFELGDPGAPTVILPGLPVNADTWAPVVDRLPDARALDLPGLGMSSGRGHLEWRRWLDALTAGTDGTDLIGHSIGSAAALETASVSPDRIRRLTLVAPFFLQRRGNLVGRFRPLTRAYLRRVQPAPLSRHLTGDDQHASALASSVSDLRRRGTAARVARSLARTSDARWRRELRELLIRYPGPVDLIVGEHDPLTPEADALVATLPRVTLTVIADAGHHPQLTHPAELAHAIADRRVAEQASC